MEATTTAKFIRIEAKGWKETSKYRITFDGRRTVGTVTRVFNSTRTGGTWIAKRGDGTYVGGFQSRKDAAEALR